MRRRIGDGNEAQVSAELNTVDQSRRCFNQSKSILKCQVLLFSQPPSAHGLKGFDGIRHELSFRLLEGRQKRSVCRDGTSPLAILGERH